MQSFQNTLVLTHELSFDLRILSNICLAISTCTEQMTLVSTFSLTLQFLHEILQRYTIEIYNFENK